MDNCVVDVLTEFLAVAFHNILYYASVYPESVFESRRKYSVVVHRCIHPEVVQYIDLCLKSALECMKNGQLNSVEFAVTDSEYKPLIKFVFNIENNSNHDETKDAYLIQCEQNLRAFCLHLSAASSKFKNLPEDCSFSIFLHTNESTSVCLATNQELEEFPFVEVNEKMEETHQIIPLRRFTIRNCNLDAFIELT